MNPVIGRYLGIGRHDAISASKQDVPGARPANVIRQIPVTVASSDRGNASIGDGVQDEHAQENGCQ